MCFSIFSFLIDIFSNMDINNIKKKKVTIIFTIYITIYNIGLYFVNVIFDQLIYYCAYTNIIDNFPYSHLQFL